MTEPSSCLFQLNGRSVQTTWYSIEHVIPDMMVRFHTDPDEKFSDYPTLSFLDTRQDDGRCAAIPEGMELLPNPDIPSLQKKFPVRPCDTFTFILRPGTSYHLVYKGTVILKLAALQGWEMTS